MRRVDKCGESARAALEEGSASAGRMDKLYVPSFPMLPQCTVELQVAGTRSCDLDGFLPPGSRLPTVPSSVSHMSLSSHAFLFCTHSGARGQGQGQGKPLRSLSVYFIYF